ncbi:MAG: hypothetical protein K2P45_11640 [Eubacterium sp.]|nr:hypothetical protein [Eubacterium sp.]
MNGFRQRMTKFMYGRYGNDQLSRLYLGLALACLVMNLFTDLTAFYLAGIALLIYGIYRSFSKDIARMSAQNQKYLNWRYQRLVKFNNTKKHWAQRKEYRFYQCPGCRQKVRVPRGRGKIAITCPKCHAEFIKKS